METLRLHVGNGSSSYPLQTCKWSPWAFASAGIQGTTETLTLQVGPGYAIPSAALPGLKQTHNKLPEKCIHMGRPLLEV